MYKLRIIALSFIFALLVPIMAVPVQVKADTSNINAVAHLAGAATPVLTELTTCAIGLITDKTLSTLRGAEVGSEEFDTAAANLGITDAESSQDMRNQAVAARKQQLCITPIERAAAQVILNTITTATINMINTGNMGNPFYDQNPQSDLQKMQTKGLLDFAVTISDTTKFPFGKDILKQTLGNYNSSYSTKGASDLGASISINYPSLTAKDFGLNLASGGWDAFESGLKPNNNAIGANFQAQEHLDVVLDGTQYSPGQALKDELNWGKGFLSQTKCLDPGFDPTGTSTCVHTQIVTPGSQIADSLNTALGAQTQQLVSGQQLDASITAIFNAMINKLLQNGLSSLTDSTGNNSASDSTSSDSTLTAQATVTGNATAGGLCGVTDSTDWYKEYPTFNIFNDIGDDINPTAPSTDVNGNPITLHTGLYAREGQLRQVLVEQDKTLDWIIKAVYILDMCIPGPSSVGNANIKSQIYGQIMQKYNYPGSSVDQVNEIYNAQFISDNLGVSYFPDDKIKTPGQVQKIIKTLVGRYYDAMSFEYSHLNLIQSYPKVEQYYQKLTVYQQEIADNQAKIALIDGTRAQLKEIKAKLQAAGSDQKKIAVIQGEFNALIPDLDVSPYFDYPSKNPNTQQQGQQQVISH